MKKLHEPVLLKEVLEALEIDKRAHLKNKVFIDATVGLGGYSYEIITRGGTVLGIDADKKSLKIAEKNLRQACPSLLSPKEGYFKLVQGNFKDIDVIADGSGFKNVDGIVYDLGISSYQLGDPSSGLSFQNQNAPLDMRLDKESNNVTAADLVNALPEPQLTELFSVVLSKSKSRKLAKNIVQARKARKIKTVGDFCEIVEKKTSYKSKLHPATLAFLALRIAVNSELENLKGSLPKAFALLGKGKRLVVVSFHSGEDALVKSFFRMMENKGKARRLFKRPVMPKKEEVIKNPRARSARMRVLIKI